MSAVQTLHFYFPSSAVGCLCAWTWSQCGAFLLLLLPHSLSFFCQSRFVLFAAVSQSVSFCRKRLHSFSTVVIQLVVPILSISSPFSQFYRCAVVELVLMFLPLLTTIHSSSCVFSFCSAVDENIDLPVPLLLQLLLLMPTTPWLANLCSSVATN